MDREEPARRYSSYLPEQQIRLLAGFGHNLTIAARDTYDFQAPGVRDPERLRQINEVHHRVFAHIRALTSSNEWRYPDDVLISILLEHEDKHLAEQTLWAFEEAIKRTEA